MPTAEQIEAGARALAAVWGDHWECVCSEQRGLDCDCGDALTEERADHHDDRMSREDYREAARVVLATRETN